MPKPTAGMVVPSLRACVVVTGVGMPSPYEHHLTVAVRNHHDVALGRPPGADIAPTGDLGPPASLTQA